MPTTKTIFLYLLFNMTTPIYECLINKKTSLNPIWFMRQAGRYLPEFREIRKLNPDFINLCLNDDLCSEITLQPLKRFDLSAAIIFSDILMVPYGLKQKVNFKKDFGPQLGEVNLKDVSKEEFLKKLKPIYNCINKVKSNNLIRNKNLIGFIGAPWTLLVYMINKKSPKKKIDSGFFDNKNLINELLKKLEKFLIIHIENQIDNGADIIQIFDSWAGLLDKKDLPKYVYEPTLKLVNFVKSKKIPVICFPREIKNYKEYVENIKPDAISIDYQIDPHIIKKEIKIPIQGGPNPNILLSSKENIKKEALKYLDIFKDHPYIFNLGHGVLPETDPMMIDYLVKFVNDY